MIRRVFLLLSTMFLTSAYVPTFANTIDVNSNIENISTIEERGLISTTIKAFKKWVKKIQI